MIFICNAKEDEGTAKQLYQDLKQAGFTPWMADRDLLGGQNRELEIKKAVKQCAAFLALISKTAVAGRGRFQKDMKWALAEYEEFPEGALFLIPVSLDGTEPGYEQMRDLVTVDLSRSYDGGLRKIIDALEACPSSETAEPHIAKGKPMELTEEKVSLRKAIENHPLVRSENGEDRKEFLVRCGVGQIFEETDRNVPTSNFIDLVLFRLDRNSLTPKFIEGFNELNKNANGDLMSDQKDSPKKLWDIKLDFIREAIKAVPAVRWALGVGGTAAVISLVLSPQFGLPPKTAVIGLILAFILMGILVIFSTMASQTEELKPLAKIFSWFVLAVFMAVTVLLIGCAFFDYPKPLAMLFS